MPSQESESLITTHVAVQYHHAWHVSPG